MRLLAIDTSAAHCSAALYDADTLTQRLAPAQRRHGELIVGMMDELLQAAGLRAAELDAFAFARGPGSFTGLRIAAAVVQGAALAADKPVVGVSTLAALAQGCRRDTGAQRVLCALDARMGEVYAGAYTANAQGLMEALLDDRVCAPEAVAVPGGPGPWAAAGSGWQTYPEVLAAAVRAACGTGPASVEAERPCEAQDVAVLAAADYAAGALLDPADALPVYLRDRVTSSAAK
ncbi:tRNA (adenosine(37)-N6)-threonylcarbamoyltransferase complex dimerization subunit type 1 TsaB [Thiohalocapsa halophila]